MSDIVGLDLVQRILDLSTSVVDVTENDLDRQEALFAVLDNLLDDADRATIEAVLRSAIFLEIKDRIHARRAAYEYAREMLLADEIIAELDAEIAEGFRSHGWYDKALDFETAALAPYHCKSILFVGSGPFPTSPMAFLRNNPDAVVTCMERYADACEKARKVADISGMENLRIKQTDGVNETDFSAYDCVIVGLVVGAVDALKSSVVDHFLNHVPDETLLCFRTADGSGRVIYPGVDQKAFEEIPHHRLQGPPHKSFTLVIVDRRG